MFAYTLDTALVSKHVGPVAKRTVVKLARKITAAPGGSFDDQD